VLLLLCKDITMWSILFLVGSTAVTLVIGAAQKKSEREAAAAISAREAQEEALEDLALLAKENAKEILFEIKISLAERHEINYVLIDEVLKRMREPIRKKIAAHRKKHGVLPTITTCTSKVSAMEIVIWAEVLRLAATTKTDKKKKGEPHGHEV